ncbi:helix-turn-helix domain-containing protein (plasmid) [Alkalihalobacillus hwajinpoensis]|uniref:helix-turn-helix domain-containing protein n=1 Tax=Guptibacillus hwajinpoensis TaxID=208199 RepID=UPI001883610D|nr:helix-turn-helix domain-containing protein [Pseudalkalibacillus hwajinpoensis]MBF0706623.1 helix-turn-helix domain-containing protein [Pseudalkalibacillus hwajinpoensis]
MSVIGQRIKELRKGKGFTQKDLAEDIITRSYLSQIEKGSFQPSYDTLEKFALKLECSVEDFFQEPRNKALITSQTKQKIVLAESKIENGKFLDAQRTISEITDIEDLSNYDRGLYYWIIGKIAENKEIWEIAEENFEISIDIMNVTQSHKEKVRAMDSLGYTKIKLEKHAEAFKLLNDAYEFSIQQKVGGAIKTSLLINLGFAHLNMKEYHSAIRILREAQVINQETHVYVKTGQINLLLALCYKEINELEKAEKSNKMALSFFESVEDSESKASVYNNLANLYMKFSNYQKSIEVYLMAISIFERIKHSKGVLLSKTGLAQAFYLNGQYGESEKTCFEVISQPLEEQYRGYTYLILGDVEMIRTNHQKALENYTKGFDIFESNDIWWGEEVAIKRMSKVHYELEDFQQAANLLLNSTKQNDKEDILPIFI